MLFIAAIGSVAAGAECLPGDEPVVRIVAANGTRSLVLDDGRTFALNGIADASVLSGDARHAAAATDWLAANLVGRDVILGNVEKPDRYGRIPAAVFVDGQLAQAELISLGLAVAYPPAAACLDEIRWAETEARTLRRGVWAEGGTVLPAVPDLVASRTGRFAVFEGAVVSVGNRRSRTYLDFGTRWSEDVTVEVGGQAREALGGEAALAGLVGRTLRVRGMVGSRGGPVVEVGWPDQIELVTPVGPEPWRGQP